MTSVQAQRGNLKQALLLLALALSLLLLPLLARSALLGGWAPPCVFRSITGLACATCGGTRALAALGNLEPLTALKFNPFVVFGIMALCVFPFWKGMLQSRNFWGIFWGVLLCNWFYLLYFKPH